MRAGEGQDTLWGGAMSDTLWGGTEEDIFYFRFISDSGLNSRDTIRDFEKGIDLIDVSDITAFDFVGGSAFAGGGQASIRTTQNAGQGRTDVHLDSNGDGVADGVIELTGLYTLEETDFIL